LVGRIRGSQGHRTEAAKVEVNRGEQGGVTSVGAQKPEFVNAFVEGEINGSSTPARTGINPTSRIRSEKRLFSWVNRLGTRYFTGGRLSKWLVVPTYPLVPFSRTVV
jgi:hypothetical protein